MENNIQNAIDSLSNISKVTESALDVGKIVLEEMNLDFNSYIATLIYISADMNIMDYEKINNTFGNELSNIVENLNKTAAIPQKKYKNHIENYIKFILTISGDVRVVYIILAEQVYKMRNIQNLSKSEKEHTAEKIKVLYSQIAHRLGLYKIKTELDELMMKHFNYDIYISIARKLNAKVKERESYITNFISPLKKKLTEKGYLFTIKGRPKSISSIWKKMQRQGAKFEEVYDLFAIRIIIDINQLKENDACWDVFSLITQQYKSHPKRLRDWLSSPKANGYKSLHATVLGPEEKWIEVQIRTKLMDKVAESGLAAHWKYKAYSKKENNKEDFFSKIISSLEKSADDKVDKEKKTLYSNEIFIFTPNGDLKKVENGSTVLDFAFLIHTSIGAKCIGAKVNNKYCSYKHVLSNGDSVKIIISKKQKPKRDWIDVAQTIRTKRKIKQLLKQQEYKQALIGKELLQRKFKRLNIKFIDENIIKLENHFNCKKRTVLFQNFGDDTYDIKSVKAILEKDKDKKNINKIVEIEETEDSSKTKRKTEDTLYIDKNLSSIEYQRAKCCNPIPGDKIYAFISVGRGAIIHRKKCPNTENILLKYPYRIINAKWKADIIDFSSPMTIMILGKDRLGIANTITNIISNEEKIKMKSLSVKEEKNDNFTAHIVVVIKNKEQLSKLINRLLKIKDVFKVARLR